MASRELQKERNLLFYCQKCGSALKLDSSLAAIPDRNFIQDITAPMYGGAVIPQERCIDDSHLQYTSNYARHFITTSTTSDDSVSDFAVIGAVGAQPVAVSNIGQTMSIQSALFDMLSAQANIDHPLCEDCTDVLLDRLDQQLKNTEEECRAYNDFLEQLESEAKSDEQEEYRDTLHKLEAEEAELIKKVNDLELECKKLDLELMAETGKQNDLKSEEQEFLKEYNELKRQVIELESEDRSVENEVKYAEAQLERLTKMNAFNSAFHIWHNGHFGTINGFRLGRLPNNPVDWTEINTAWGQTVLLLHSLAKKMGLVFERFRLVPFGSHSYMESLQDKVKELPLHCTGGMRFFWDTKFDQAMVAFLDCLEQFKCHVEKGDSQFRFPYKMSNGRLEDVSTASSYSIKIQLNSEEQWTKALKFMLTNLRWGLTWVSSQYANND